jgi:hypothetical protein
VIETSDHSALHVRLGTQPDDVPRVRQVARWDTESAGSGKLVWAELD